MRNLSPSHFYAVNYDDAVRIGRPDAKPLCVDPERLAELLPHGSGIDGDWYITAHLNGSFTIEGEFHCMNDNGFYSDWRSFSCRLYREPRDKIVRLSGPCEGKVQILARRGDLAFSIHGDGRPGFSNGLDYLYDVIRPALDPIIPPKPSEIVELPTATVSDLP